LTGQNSFWFANPSTGFYPFEIGQSLRITNNGYLNMSTNGFANAPTLTTKGTVSFWIKLQNNGGRNYILQNEQAYSNDGLMDIRFGGSGSNDGMHVGRLSDTPYTASSTGPKQRDYSNWYHCVVGFDSTSATASDRQIRIYINGTQVTTGSFGAINQNAHFPLTKQGSTYGGLTFGAHPNPSFNYFTDMILAEVNIIDGQRLDASYFGEFKNGTWIPIEYTGTYGNNGCRFTFASSDFNVSGGSVSDPNGSSVDLFNNGISDASGNGNHLNLNSVSTHDILLDSPTNNFMTFNALHRADTSLDLREGNLHAHCDSDDGVFTTIEIPTSGKWYVEFVLAHVSKPTGVYILGNKHKTRDDWTHVANYTSNIFGFGITGSTNKVRRYGDSTNLGSTHTSGMIYAFLINCDAGTYDIYQNDTKILDAQSFTHPGANEGLIIGVGNNSDSGTANCNFYLNAGQDSSFFGTKTAQGNTDANGIGDFYYSTKGGLALCSSNLPDTTLSPNKAEQADDHFNTVIYTGNGTADRAINVGFATDFFWVKQRSAGNHHQLTDTSRGVLKGLSTSNTTIENTFDSVRSFTSTGVTVGTSATTNTSSETYVAWNWKANGGTTSSNTDGSITSTVQANTTAGFSIVTYTGTGSAGTIGHGLGAVPKWIMIKGRDNEKNWIVYHAQNTTAPETEYLHINKTEATQDSAIFFNDTAPTSSVISLGNGNNVNDSGNTYVAYVFAEIEGYSKFGSYTGNGNAEGTFVYTGFRPAFIIVKRTDSSGNWTVYDNVRLGYNVANYQLYPNLSSTEGSSTHLDILSNGFKWRTSDANRNANNGTFVYMAFAEQPFKFSNAR